MSFADIVSAANADPLRNLRGLRRTVALAALRFSDGKADEASDGGYGLVKVETTADAATLATACNGASYEAREDGENIPAVHALLKTDRCRPVVSASGAVLIFGPNRRDTQRAAEAYAASVNGTVGVKATKTAE